MATLLADDPGLDAVFVASDLMADGALRTLRRAGRRVPDDVAVIGFDDVEMARYTEPPLTTIRQPIVELGRQLAGQVLRCGREIEPARSFPPN
jgi:DNA-binding LacI/PurR family transcriptional regulator